MDTSNDARREAARRLNRYACDEMEGGSLLETLEAVTGATSWRGCLTELAMLIKPHECHVVENDQHYWRCSRCGAFVYWDAVTDTSGVLPTHFCPNCGAEVVRDGE